MRLRKIAVGVGAVLAAILALLLVLAFLINTGTIRQYILRIVVGRAEQAANQPVSIRAIAFHWFPLRVALSGITIGSGADPATPPLLTLDNVEVGIGIGLLHRPNVRLRSVIVSHPVLHLATYAQGQLIIGPKHSTSPSAGNSNPADAFFNIGIGDLEIANGELYFNDRPASLTVEAHDLGLAVSRGLLTDQYDGSLNYDRGVVRIADYRPLTHDLSATFEATRSTFSLKSLVVQAQTSRVTAQAELSNYDRPNIQGTYSAILASGELSVVLRQPMIQAGAVQTQGTVSYASDPTRPLIANLHLVGKLSGSGFSVRAEQASLPIENISTDYELISGDLKIRNARASLLQGRLSGDLNARNISDDPLIDGETVLQGISLAAIERALSAQVAGLPQVAGAVNGTARVVWQQKTGLRAHSDLEVIGPSATSIKSGQIIPFSGTIHADYDGAKQTLTLQNTSLRTTSTLITLSGTLAKQAGLRVGIQANDLSEVDRLALVFRSKSGNKNEKQVAPAQLLGLSGRASFNAMVTGDVSNPRVAGSFEAGPFQIHNAAFATLRASVDLDQSQLALHQGQLRRASQGRADFDCTVALSKWSFSSQSQVSLRVNAAALEVADLEQISGSHYPVSGTISANVELAGTEENPMGKGTLTVAKVNAWGQAIENVQLQLQGTGTQVDVTATIQTLAGTANTTLTFKPQTSEYTFRMETPSGVRLADLSYIQSKNMPLSGTVNVSAEGQGSLKEPQLQIELASRDLKFGQQEVNGFAIHSDVAQGRATFSAAATISGASLSAHGAVNLKDDYEASASIDTQTVQIGPLLAAYLQSVPRDLVGQIQAHASLEGPIARPAELKSTVDIPALSLQYKNLQLSAANPIHLTYSDGALVLSKADFRGTGTDLSVEGNVPFEKGAKLRASLNGGIDLELLRLLNPDWQGSGKLNVQVSAQGTVAQPDVQGNARIADGVLLIPGVPGIENAAGEIDFDGKRLAVKNLSGQIGGGPFQVSGSATYEKTLQLNLGMRATSVRVLYPEGVSTRLDADLNVTGGSQGAALNGRVVLNQVSTTQAFDLTSLTSQLSGESSPSTGFASNLHLNVDVSSSDQLSVASGQVSISGSAQLHVQGTAADPVIVGRTTLTGGELFFQGKRFEITRGVIQFSNPTRTSPVLNLTATTTVNQFDINIAMTGPFDRLHVNYSSDPPLPPVDVISLLISGRTTEAAQASPTNPTELLAGQLTGQVSSRIQKLTGLSSLTIDPQIGGNQGDATSQLALQQRVTKNMLFTFSTNITNDQEPAVGVEYQATRKYTLSATRDQSGGYQVEVKLHKTF